MAKETDQQLQQEGKVEKDARTLLAGQQLMIRQLSSRLAKLDANDSIGIGGGLPVSAQEIKQEAGDQAHEGELQKLSDIIAQHVEKMAELEEKNSKLVNLNSKCVEEAQERDRKNVELRKEVSGLHKRLVHLVNPNTSPAAAGPSRAACGWRMVPRIARDASPIGLTTVKHMGETFVRHVEPGSPAHRAGLAYGDHIAMVNGKHADLEASLDALVAAGPEVSQFHVKISPFEERQALARDPNGEWTPREMTSNLVVRGHSNDRLKEKAVLSVNGRSTRNLSKSKLQRLFDQVNDKLDLTPMTIENIENLDASGHQIVEVRERRQLIVHHRSGSWRYLIGFAVTTRVRKSKSKE